MSQIEISHPKYRPDIDGLRAIAILSVILFHAFPEKWSGGFVGVDVFFVISGFLISSTLFENLNRGTFSFLDFYSRRIRRIFPSLLLILVFSLGFGVLFLMADEFKQLGQNIFASGAFFQNINLWKESGYFDNASELKPLLHIWSLGIEEQFYFVWPLLLWLASFAKTSQKRTFFLVLTLGMGVLSFLINKNLVTVEPIRTFYLPQYRFWELLAGGALSWMTLYAPPLVSRFNVWSASRPIFNDVFSGLGLLGLLWAFYSFNRHTVFPGVSALLPVLATVLMIHAGMKSFLNRKILAHKILVWIGLISFPLYLWHWPLLSFARILEGHVLPTTLRWLIVLISFLLAWVSTRFVEKPLRFGGNTNLKVLLLSGLMISVSGVGYFVYKKDGFAVVSEDERSVNSLIANAEKLCDQKFPQWKIPGDANTCKMQNEKNTVAVIGDSHAGHLYFGLVAASRKSGSNIAVFPTSCAAPLLDVATLSRNRGFGDLRRSNWRLMNDALAFAANSPDIKTVLLAHDPDCSYGDATDFENPNEASYETVLKNGFDRTLKLLTSKQKQVIIVLDNPHLPFDPHQCARTSVRGGRFVSDANCSFTRESDSMDRYQKIVEAEIKKYPMVKVVDLAKSFCNSMSCSPLSADGTLLYMDESHLNSNGSRFVAPILLEMIQK